MVLKKVKSYQTVVVEKDVSISFKCDICGRVITLDSDYDITYKNKVSDHMAVVKYGHPSGGHDSRTIYEVLHCCSSDCVFKAIKKVPFDAKISIPMGDYFIK